MKEMSMKTVSNVMAGGHCHGGIHFECGGTYAHCNDRCAYGWRLLQGRIFAGRLRAAENGIRQDITDIQPARVCISKLVERLRFSLFGQFLPESFCCGKMRGRTVWRFMATKELRPLQVCMKQTCGKS